MHLSALSEADMYIAAPLVVVDEEDYFLVAEQLRDWASHC